MPGDRFLRPATQWELSNLKQVYLRLVSTTEGCPSSSCSSPPIPAPSSSPEFNATYNPTEGTDELNDQHHKSLLSWHNRTKKRPFPCQKRPKSLCPLQPTRQLPSSPVRILDAPGVLDDYFLNCLDWSVRGVVGVGLQDSVYTWSLEGGVCHLTSLSSNPTHSDADEGEHVTAVSWSHDGHSMAIGSSLGLTHVWDVGAGGRRIRSIPASLGHACPTLSWNKHLLSIGSQDGHVQTHDVRLRHSLVWDAQQCSSTGNAQVCGLKWSPDGRWLAGGTSDGTVAIYAMANGNVPVHTSQAHRAAVKAVAWSPTGALATGGGSACRTLITWDMATGEPRSHRDTGGQVSALTWSKKGPRVELVAGLTKPATISSAISASGGGSSAASAIPEIAFFGGGGGGTSINPALPHLGSIKEAHPRRILQLVCSPDGEQLCSLGGDETVRFWECWPSSHLNANDDDGDDGPKKPRDDERPRKLVLVPPTMPTRARRA